MQFTSAMRGIALTMLCALTGAAHADGDAATKSEDTAFWLSAGGTLGSVGLVGVGLAMTQIFPGGQDNETRLLKVPLHNWGNGIATAGLLASGLAPSFGEWYTGDFLTGGLGLRLAGAAVMGLGAATNHCIDPADFDCSADHGTSNTLLALGAVTYGVGVIYDVAAARGHARDYNRSHGATAILVPTGTGVSVVGRF